MSILEALLKLDQPKDNVCRFCKKIFCCSKCRDRHVNKVHPDLNANCSLCTSEAQPTIQFEFEKLQRQDKQLLSHIADKHLPLRCLLCQDLFRTREDLKSIGTCKWYSAYRQVQLNEVLPRTPASTSCEMKLRRTANDIIIVKYNSYTFSTPPEIYRNTSTPMFVGQKNSFDCQTPCMPNFSLKTSKIQQSHNDDSDTKFFSFPLKNEETTPFRNSADQQFSRSNSGRKLDIKQSNETVYEEAKETYDDYTTSPVSMDLTDVEDNSNVCSPEFFAIPEESSRGSDIVKKVRFSDQYETLPKCKVELDNSELENDVFHDANDVSSVKNVKSTKDTENTEENVNDDAKKTKDTKYIKEKDTKDEETKSEKKEKNENMENIEDAKSDRVYDIRRSLAQSSNDFSDDKQVNISQENKQNAEKENQAVKALANSVSTVTEEGISRVLMMVIVEKKSNSLDTDLMPLINSGLKKLEEQLVSQSSSTPEFSNVANATGYTRKSTTTLEMSVSNVETYSYSKKNAETMTDHQQAVSACPLSSVKNDKSNNGGFMSAFAQAVKLVFRNWSGMTSSSIKSSQVVEQQQIAENAVSLPETHTRSNPNKSIEVRCGKRARDVNEISSLMDSVPLSVDTRSPLPKRKKEWYEIKGRRPIRSVCHNTNQVTSPRGVSLETQIFSQGSLTVGDTVLPLPARAHSEASLTPAE